MLVLDTHVLVWLDEGSTRLGAGALQSINEALVAGQLAVATISFWEIGMLCAKGRLVIKTELDVWRTDLLKAGLQEIALRGTAALRAAQLYNFHGDPADRLIVATAMELGASLVTADEKILHWQPLQQSIDARL